MHFTKKAFATVSLVSVLFLAACGGNTSKTNEKAAEQINFLETGELLTLNTTAEEDFVSFTAQNQVFEGLYTLDKKDNFVPGVAASMPVISKDQTEYTIKLRDNAKWSDGSQVTADDFVYAWRRAVDPKTAPSYAALFKDSIKNATEIHEGKLPVSELGVTAPDKETLKITLKKPVPYFISLLSFETFFPQKQAFVEKQGDKYGTDAAHTLYNGPFVMKNWDGNTAKKWTYAKNNEYWDKKQVAIDEISVQVAKDINAGVNLYTTKEADRAPLSGEYAKQYKDRSDFLTEKDALVSYLRLNQKRDGKPTPLANNSLRHALNLAVDKEALTSEILGDGSFPANGLLPKDFVQNPETGADFRADSGDHLTFNKVEASKYLAQAKKELGTDTITLELLGDDQDTTKTIFTFLKDQFEKNLPGVTINIKTMPAKSATELTRTSNYDLSLAAWMPDFKDPWTYSSLFLSDYYNNSMNYNSPKYDQLVKSTDTTLATEPNARWNAFVESEKVLLDDDAAILPLYQHQTAVLQNPKVTGVQKHAFGSPYSYKFIEMAKN
ncbi:peptide ABC transporter substrate-binding protein [Listeria newyorkensis]|uniref:Peptide ABC transporter substrate-binding protein n=1 Tax=Listeria newyorkensis TaxID=1497681 RepID=A0ABX4XPR8_9LIST|nr:peptide ABC transporter substrate-binding protein [Listeria newyorkensis]KGL41930.1 peptide ABC transporter substrate-binding protein [Listeria newyorkensis]PNP93952.1 peptide ABC transporter substrate-binding protein [Listeria newyorkensis]WAO22578.1 peptide ABC transporter substrate-binding protein [Listeria newyorkensis]SQC51304.1 Periplasmic oligopeptide-binding protein precursor [Listeria newyorkensis]